MKKSEIIQYYVEGENEKSLINALKRDCGAIKSGKEDIFNPVQNRFTKTRVMALKPGTSVVLVYDTDIETNLDILKYNVNFLHKQSGIKDVVCIPQVYNLEDELVYSCDIKSVLEITKSSSLSNFKNDFNKCSNLSERLTSCGFNISKMWSRIPDNSFVTFCNDSQKIKKY